MNKKILIVTAAIILAIFFIWTTVFYIKKSGKLIEAFEKVERGLDSVNRSYNLPIAKIHSKHNQPKADSLVKATNSLCSYLDSLKHNLITNALKSELQDSIVLEKKHVVALKGKLKTYKNFVNNHFPNQMKDLSERINTEDIIEFGDTISWEEYNFEHNNLGRIILLLSVTKNEIKAISRQLLDELE